MNPLASHRLITLALLLSAFASFAQPVSSVYTNFTEVLPASSPYGAAVVKRDISYAVVPNPHHNFDLYLPTNSAQQPFPLILWIHGGAWMAGSKEWNNVKYLVRHGYAIATIDYRPSTDAKFPAQIQDCNRAMNFILEHAAEYGINPRQFVVAGGSAGGHLALLLGLARLEPDFGATPATKPLAILDFFGPTDFNRMRPDLEEIRSANGLKLLHDAGSNLLGAPIEQVRDKARFASPIHYVIPSSPPVLILQGAKDDLVPTPQSQRLHAALDLAGVTNQLIVLDNAGHDGPLFSTPAIAQKVTNFLARVFTEPGPATNQEVNVPPGATNPPSPLDATVYFPKGTESWYPKHLKAMKEPSIYERRSTTNASQFRFLWLRTFHDPIAIRIEKDASGINLRAVTLSGSGGSDPGSIAHDETIEVTDEQWNTFLRLQARASFWNLPTKEAAPPGLDGSQWILEGLLDGKYHVVDRWSPQPDDPTRNLDAYIAACRYLLELSKLEIPKNEFY